MCFPAKILLSVEGEFKIVNSSNCTNLAPARKAEGVPSRSHKESPFQPKLLWVLSEVVDRRSGVAIEMVGIRMGIPARLMIMSGNGGMAGISGGWAGMRASMECWNIAYLEVALD